MEPDRELGLACMRSYNDWVLEDFQGANAKRIRLFQAGLAKRLVPGGG